MGNNGLGERGDGVGARLYVDGETQVTGSLPGDWPYAADFYPAAPIGLPPGKGSRHRLQTDHFHEMTNRA